MIADQIDTIKRRDATIYKLQARVDELVAAIEKHRGHFGFTIGEVYLSNDAELWKILPPREHKT